MDHLIEHDHHHHGHGHDHSHDHAHGMGDYYLEQLIGILICGLFGVAAVLSYVWGRLTIMLAPEFHILVLAGGLALLIVTAIRATSVWVESGKHSPGHGHGHHHHVHEHDHHHDGDCCGHDHAGHDHSHGGSWVYLKTIVLSFPLLLFFIGVPNQGFSREWIESRLGPDADLGNLSEVAAKGGDIIGYDFAQLAAAALDSDKRELIEGRTVSIRGQFKPLSEREFTLFKMKMNCCAADAIPLKARILTTFVPYGQQYGKWVQVTGTVQFVQEPGKRDFIPVIRVTEESGIRPAPQES